MGEFPDYNKNKMNRGTVLYIGNFELPDKGASANRVRINALLFSKIGYQVILFGLNNSESFTGIRKVDNYINMYEKASPQSTREWLVHILSVRDIREMINSYPDTKIIILYNAPYSLYIISKIVFSSIKVVYDCTEWTGETLGSPLKRAVKSIDAYMIKRFLGRTASGIIVVSKMMEKAYSKNKNMIRIPPLVDINDSIWHQFDDKIDTYFEFCYAGTPGEPGKKDYLDIIIRAWKQMNNLNTRLRILGISKEDFLIDYPEMSSLLDGHVFFMGKVSHYEAVYYVENSDCNVIIRMPNQRNNAGFPTKFVEAYTCGNVVVTSNVSDISDYSCDRVLLLENMDTSYVAEMMKRAYEIGKTNCGNMLRDSFHYEKYYDSCYDWFSRLMNEGVL